MERDLDYHYIINVMRRATQIAANADLGTLLDRTLDLFVQVAGAEAGTLYLYDSATDELVFLVVQGDEASRRLIGARIPADRGIAGAALRAGHPIFIPDVLSDPRWDRTTGELSRLRLRTMYCLPLSTGDHPVGVVQVFNLSPGSVDDDSERDLLRLLGDAIVGAIDKTRLLEESRRLLEQSEARARRLRVLGDIQTRLTTTLDRNDLLTLIMNHARDLLGVEATSVWELDEQRNLLVLHVATGERGEHLREVTVPVGQGIIGHVVATGETVMVEDVSKDTRHYQQIDERSGFVTRSILCVPLRAPRIVLGPDRGDVAPRIIGGAQALNKRDGVFTQDDIALFEMFASQAATALQISRLYAGMQRLFDDTIKIIANLSDARDPYTYGHSARVSEFAVAIAEELGWKETYQVRVGGILHDIGKIGVPDAILNKKERLTDEEYARMKQHPTIGYNAMRDSQAMAGYLPMVLPAILEHHVRVDGGGYPSQRVGATISKVGQIVHVADVFDALTSTGRPYRSAIAPEEAIEILRRGSGTEFDPECVDAFVRAWEKGKIRLQ
ncbi:MAG TPA: GAF domain-containing protein [Roseiflexaceae bacterium]|nr:GAF domain-containing protein [Roseiflexaceae bacterium]